MAKISIRAAGTFSGGKTVIERGVAVVGSTTIDRIVKSTRSQRKLGGVTTYAGLTYKRHGIDTWIVSNVAPKDEPILQALRREGLRVRIGTTEKTTHFVNYIDADDRRQEVPFTAAPIKYSQIADVLEYAAFLHLGPLYPQDIEAEAIERLHGSPFPIGLDIQGYVRQIKDGIVYPVVSEHLAIALEVSQVVKASLEELNLVLDSYRISLADLMTFYTIEEFVVTMGSKGGFVRKINGEEIYYNAKSIAELVDPTGAGDVFFAAYIFSRFFETKDLADASKLAASTAGQQVEGKYITANELNPK